jgi:maleate cis-trans isomerase
MTGWRAQLGFLVPPGNRTIEPEMIALAPAGVPVHFSRLVAHGPSMCEPIAGHGRLLPAPVY